MSRMKEHLGELIDVFDALADSTIALKYADDRQAMADYCVHVGDLEILANQLDDVIRRHRHRSLIGCKLTRV